MRKVYVRAPASSGNLGSGFDCLGLALKLYDELIVEELERGKQLHIEVEGEGALTLPRGPGNEVWRAMCTIFEAEGYKAEALSLKLKNQIPLARGLGSSAAARLAGVMAACSLCGLKLTQSEILKRALPLEGHPDNLAASLLGGLVVSCEAGSETLCVKLKIADGLKAIVAVPDFELMTEEARRILPGAVPFADAVFNLSRGTLLVAAMCAQRLELLGEAMRDKLHQPYRKALVAPMERVFQSALSAGAKGVALSGAGPSILALADCKFDEIGRAMAEAFSASGVASKVLILDIDDQGALCSRDEN